MRLPQFNPSIPEWKEMIWRFLRGDASAADFEEWVNEAPNLKTILGSDLYLQAIETDYGDKLKVYELERGLRLWIEHNYPPSCNCLIWPDHQRIGLGYETADLLEKDFAIECQRNEWLKLAQCLSCGQAWYVAIDTIDDDCYFLRLSADQLLLIRKNNDWPPDFDGFVNVWPIEESQRILARLHWPWKDEDKGNCK